MVIQVTQKNIRQAPRKVRQVADAVRGLSLEKALAQLSVIQRKPTVLLLKMIRQGIADATHNHGLSATDLSIKSVVVEEGPFYKRFRAVSRGRAHTVQKKTCHVKIELETGVSEKNKQSELHVKKEKKTKAVSTQASSVSKKSSKQTTQPKEVKSKSTASKAATKKSTVK